MAAAAALKNEPLHISKLSDKLATKSHRVLSGNKQAEILNQKTRVRCNISYQKRRLTIDATCERKPAAFSKIAFLTIDAAAFFLQ